MSLVDSADELFMARALELARRGWGDTHPNPMVGAVIACDGEILAEGWHRRAGGPHAEVAALADLGERPPPGATLYVTLEPCSTKGRTGACTDAIMKAGIGRVVVGASDPNPAHAGRGLEQLEAAGVQVTAGVMAAECADLNLIFNHWITRGTPFFALKLALTLDGKCAAASGHSRWVTSDEARADVMRWRRYFPAIAVGATTVLADDPKLTSRIGNTEWCPRRIVLDSRLETLTGDSLPQLYTDPHRDRTVVACLASADPERLEKAGAAGVALWTLPADASGRHIDWSELRQRCAAAELFGVYVEAGPRLATTILAERRADYAFVYQAAKFMLDSDARSLGTPRQTQSMEEAIQLSGIRTDGFTHDVLTRGYLAP